MWIEPWLFKLKKKKKNQNNNQTIKEARYASEMAMKSKVNARFEPSY